ncbi:MAG: cation:proton antiporter subunit C [Spirochaetales bacterium]|nr:cation:proton antiporter subunit C [Spirochaetales bacterium]
MAAYVLIMVLFLVGLWAVLAKRNLAKKIIGLSLLNTAVVILFVFAGGKDAETAPILLGSPGLIADPLPQALMLTAIVIGVSVTALALGLVYRLYLKFDTLDIRQIEKALHGRDE